MTFLEMPKPLFVIVCDLGSPIKTLASSCADVCVALLQPLGTFKDLKCMKIHLTFLFIIERKCWQRSQRGKAGYDCPKTLFEHPAF